MSPSVADRIAVLVRQLGRGSGNKLIVAVLSAELPGDRDAALQLMGKYLASRAPEDAGAIEKNMRVPPELLKQLDQLVSKAQELVPRVNRSLLVNAILASSLPDDAERAAELVAEYERQLVREQFGL